MAFASNLTHYNIVRHLTILCIISLIVISVYYLNTSLEFLKRLIEQIDDADLAFTRHAAKNLTVSKMIIEPLRRSAHDMYQKNEPATIANIVTYTSLILLSSVGLLVAIRKNYHLLALYGMSLDLVYFTSFLYVSRLKPSICAYIVFVSILTFIHARQIWLQNSASNVRILQATASDRELIKSSDRQYTYEHTTEMI